MIMDYNNRFKTINIIRYFFCLPAFYLHKIIKTKKRIFIVRSEMRLLKLTAY